MTASRRSFLKTCLAAGCAVPGAAALIDLCAACRPSAAAEPDTRAGRIVKLVEARYYEKRDEQQVRCLLCPNSCLVPNGERGACEVRENRAGTYYTLVYGNPCSGADGGVPDPIEKKPLFHFLPGTKAYSIATAGCNFDCKFCQNWQISRSRPEDTLNFELLPADVVARARRHDCSSIAFTYSEPTVYYEYMFDTAELARKQDIRSVMISNGFISAEPMSALCDVLSAVKIDLKAFTEKFYKDVAAGSLGPVLKTLQLLAKKAKWFEIVNLLIPTLNDKPAEIAAMCKWIKTELGPMVPLHFTAFYPTYKLRNLPRTPQKTVESARDIALAEGLKYVYVGNIWQRDGHPAESTLCHACGKRIVWRVGFTAREVHIKDGACEYCGAKIPGVWA